MMVFTNTGVNAIRDLFSTALTDASLGTSSTTPLVSDTALGGEDATTNLVTTNTTNDKQINVDYNIPSTTGNGTTFREFGSFDASNTLFSRQTFASLTKSSTEQWQFSIIYKINN